jgi:hypothetical protein
LVPKTSTPPQTGADDLDAVEQKLQAGAKPG